MINICLQFANLQFYSPVQKKRRLPFNQNVVIREQSHLAGSCTYSPKVIPGHSMLGNMMGFKFPAVIYMQTKLAELFLGNSIHTIS